MADKEVVEIKGNLIWFLAGAFVWSILVVVFIIVKLALCADGGCFCA